MSFLNKFRSHGKGKNSRIALVFDIGSASVAGGIVALSRDGKPRVLYSIRKKIVFQEKLDFDRFVRSMFESFDAVTQNLQKKGFSYLNENSIDSGLISTALFVYASPWYSAQTKILTIDKEEPFIVTENLISKLVSKENSTLSERIDNESLGTVTKIDEGEIIEQNITAVRLNGYNVTNINNKRTKQLELTTSITKLSRTVAGGLEDTLRDTFKIDKVKHHSFPLATFIALRDVVSDGGDFLILDVSGEVSDISLVRNESLLETASFPMGTNFITRSIMNDLQVSESEAYSILRMNSEGSLILTMPQKRRDVLLNIENEWSKSFLSTLRKIEYDNEVPNKLYFVTDKSFNNIISRFLGKTDTKSKFNAEPITYSTIKKEVEYSSGRVLDIFIGIESLLLSKLG